MDLEIEKHPDFDERNPLHWEVEKMKWGGKRPNLDKTVIHFTIFDHSRPSYGVP